MGETETPHFYDFGIFETVTKPQKPTTFIFGDTKTPKHNQENTQTFLKKYYVYKSQNLRTPMFCRFGKRRAPTALDESSKKTLFFFDLGSVSS